MTTLILAFTALAGPPAGYTELKRDNDCVVYKGPPVENGVVPVFADCHWADVAPEKLHALLVDWEGHAKVHATVAESRIEKREGERALVYQRHQLSGISDREVRIWMQRTAIDGGFEYAWKNDGVVTELQKGNVATARHEGFWRVKADPAGGSRVEYGLTYDPGGSVPGFIIRWFQAGGTVATTVELRTAGKN